MNTTEIEICERIDQLNDQKVILRKEINDLKIQQDIKEKEIVRIQLKVIQLTDELEGTEEYDTNTKLDLRNQMIIELCRSFIEKNGTSTILDLTEVVYKKDPILYKGFNPKEGSERFRSSIFYLMKEHYHNVFKIEMDKKKYIISLI